MKNAENGVYTECIHVYTKYTLLKDEDLVRSWALIDAMKPSEILDITRISPERRELFINCIKQRIRTLNDCEFNSDFTKIRKYQNYFTTFNSPTGSGIKNI